MAIIDTSISGSTIENRDSDIFLGIDLQESHKCQLALVENLSLLFQLLIFR